MLKLFSAVAATNFSVKPLLSADRDSEHRISRTTEELLHLQIYFHKIVRVFENFFHTHQPLEHMLKDIQQ